MLVRESIVQSKYALAVFAAGMFLETLFAFEKSLARANMVLKLRTCGLKPFPAVKASLLMSDAVPNEVLRHIRRLAWPLVLGSLEVGIKSR